MRIRQANEGDWAVVRDLRLRSLADATVADAVRERESGFAERHWRMRLRGSAWYLAEDAGAAGGLVGVLQEPGAPEGERHVQGLWAGTDGVSDLLLDTVAREAAQGGAERLTAWVADGDEVTGRRLGRRGFTPTGAVLRSPRDGRLEHRLELSLGDRPPTGEARRVPQPGSEWP